MDLCGKKHVFSFAIPERFSDDLFAPAAPDLKLQWFVPVHVGSIKIIDPHVQRFINDPRGLFFALPASKVHAAQTKLAYFNPGSPKIYIVHAYSFNLVL